jgi:hypothetical protein
MNAETIRRGIMARVESNPELMRAVAYGATALISAIVGIVLWAGIQTDSRHGERITALESRQNSLLIEIDRRLTFLERYIREQ